MQISLNRKKLLNECEQFWSASAAKLYRLANTNAEYSTEDIYVKDHTGKSYIDCACSYGVFIVGHQNPVVRSLAVPQLSTLAWANNDKNHDSRNKLTERLQNLVRGEWGDISYMVSGAEAIEQTLRYVLKIQAHKQNIIVMKNSYHGKTLAAMNILGQDQHHSSYGKLSSEVIFIDYGDINALKNALGETGAKAVYIEPILGGAHLTIPSKGYLSQVAELCKNTRTLLVADEIQTAFGRCGEMFAVDYEKVVPDIMVLSKGLTGGYASIACVLYSKQLIEKYPLSLVDKDMKTNGGHPFACSAALGAIEYIEKNNLVEASKQKGKFFAEGLAKLAKKYSSIIHDAPAIGLMTGLRLKGSVYETLICMELGKRGIHAGHSMNEKATSPVLRFYPPLQIEQKNLEHILAMLDESLAVISNYPKPLVIALQYFVTNMYRLPNSLLKLLQGS